MMKLYSERFKNVASCPIPTYDEILIVKHGFIETELPNSIVALQSTQWGFIKVAEGLAVEVKNPIAVEPVAEEPVAGKPAAEVIKTKKQSPKKTEEPAMTMSDVDAIMGSGKKIAKSRRPKK